MKASEAALKALTQEHLVLDGLFFLTNLLVIVALLVTVWKGPAARDASAPLFQSCTTGVLTTETSDRIVAMVGIGDSSTDVAAVGAITTETTNGTLTATFGEITTTVDGWTVETATGGALQRALNGADASSLQRRLMFGSIDFVKGVASEEQSACGKMILASR